MTEDAWLPVPGSPWQRLDPRSIAVQPLVVIRSGGFPAVLAVAGVASQLGWWALFLVPLLLLAALLIGVLTYLSTSYLVADGQVRVRRGLINRRTLTANLDKVRSVDLEAPLLHRLIGVSKVEIGTGVDNTRIELDSLGRQQAQELRLFLLRRSDEAAQQHDRAEHDASTPPPAAPVPEEELARLDPRWSRYAPLKLGGLAVVAGGIGALSQVVDEDTWSELAWADSAWSWLAQQVLAIVVVAGVLLAIVAWVALSVGAYLVHWWQLRLTRTPQTLRLTAGLFTTRSTSIELSRIRGLRVTRAPLVRWADGGDLASYATGVEQGVTAVLPTAPEREVHRVGTALLRDATPLHTPLREHGPAALARLRFRGAMGTLLVAWIVMAALVATVLQPTATRTDTVRLVGGGLVVIALAALLAWVAVRSAYRHLGHALTARHVVAGSGVFTAAREVLEIDGIIGWVVHQSFFQRRRGLADLVATTAAGPERVVVHDVPLPDAVTFAARATPAMLAGFVEGGADPVSEPARP